MDKLSKDIDKPIVLIGLMGAGKTSVGEALARATNRLFIDVDQEIEKNQKRSIADIFEKDGEPYFRDIEKATTVQTITDNKDAVISIGGGAFMTEAIREKILEDATSVFLRASLGILVDRVGNGQGRPLLKDGLQTKLESLIGERYPVYEQADITLDAKQEPIADTVKRVQAALYNYNGLS